MCGERPCHLGGVARRALDRDDLERQVAEPFCVDALDHPLLERRRGTQPETSVAGVFRRSRRLRTRRPWPGPPNPTAAEFEVDNWELSELVLHDLVPVVGTKPFPLNELLLMAGAVARFRPQTIFEWGTHVGKSARVFHDTSKALGVATLVHSIDLPDDAEHVEHPGRSRGQLVRHLPDVRLHQGDGLDVALQLMLPDSRASRTLFFLDGDHAYTSVLRELEAIADHAPTAAILVHDSFYQSPDARYNTGPSQAIGALLAGSADRYQRIDTATGLPGMTLLAPRL